MYDREKHKEYCRMNYQKRCREDSNYRIHLTELARKRRQEYPEEVKQIRRVSMRKRLGELKLQVYSLLGGKCCKCGYIGPALQLDHINGGGCKEVRNKGSTYYGNVKFSINLGENKYQLLCANCNWEKRLTNNESPIRPWIVV